MKNLPFSRISTRGFTLVELLVVISIVAILGTISMTVFSGAQGSARDGKRRSEIESIAKSIEASKDYDTFIYNYDGTQLSNDFPRGITSDTKYAYCIKSSTGTDPNAITNPVADATWAVDTCSSDYKKVSNAMTAAEFGANAKSWKVCARLERSSNLYCKTSLTK